MRIHRERTIEFHGGDTHGKVSEADAGNGCRDDPPQGGRPFQRRHRLRPGDPRVHVLPLDRRSQEQAAARVKRGTKKEESAFKRTLLTTIRSAALARNQYWTAAAWLLERKYPDEFGKADRQRDDDKSDAAPKIMLGVVARPVQQTLPLDGLGEERADG